MADGRDQVLVQLDSEELGPRRTVGVLARERGRGSSVISFAYDPAWISSSAAFPLDPSLPLYEGEQFSLALPGTFSDASTDRWGRTLIERREAQLARDRDRARRSLDDWDFLLSVDDRTRMGALRFSTGEEAEDRFLANEPLPVPPLAQLRELEHWAREAEEGMDSELSDDERWLAMLLAPGSSLGGTRPKANYLDGDELWIAKFPSRDDRHDVGAWEYVVSRLARAAGIDTPETELLSLGSQYRTFCAKRFDRSGRGRRLYASAMTLTGRRDHEDASYLDIAQAIENLGDPEAIEADLKQLFKRVVFNLLTANRDDHLRNHGFLRTEGGWRLAPAFDVNPSPRKHEHSLAIDDVVRTPDLDLVRETAPYYRLTSSAAQEAIAEVERAISAWQRVAGEAGLSGEELARIGPAFASA